MSRVIGGFSLNQPPQIFTRDKSFIRCSNFLGFLAIEGPVRKKEEAVWSATTWNNDRHLFRGSPLWSWKGYCCFTIIKHVGIWILFALEVFRARTERQSHKYHSGMTQWGHVCLCCCCCSLMMAMASKWTDLNQLMAVTSLSPGRDFHSSAPCPRSSPLLSVLQHFPEALREEPGLIDSDILVPILFSYLFHTLKVFPPLHSLSWLGKA